jgi:dsRNA-specific ribonuclease
LWQQHKLLKSIQKTQKTEQPEKAPEFREKDAISILNELYKGPPYQVGEKDGTDGLITVSLTLEGQIFKANGRSKKEAKAEVANKAISSLKIQGIFQVCIL